MCVLALLPNLSVSNGRSLNGLSPTSPTCLKFATFLPTLPLFSSPVVTPHKPFVNTRVCPQAVTIPPSTRRHHTLQTRIRRCQRP